VIQSLIVSTVTGRILNIEYDQRGRAIDGRRRLSGPRQRVTGVDDREVKKQTGGLLQDTHRYAGPFNSKSTFG
jgi:hypothetical protein